MPKVFVTDAEQGRIPLSITRSLGRKKIQVYNGGYLGITPVYFSRYCTKKVKYPFISARPGKFKKFIFKYLKENKFDVVFPVMNESVLFFSKHQEELSKYTKIPLVGYEKLIIAADKAKTMELAEKLRVPHPKTHYIYDKLELRQVANELAYPVIVKARRSYGSRGVKICRNKLHLKRAFRHISKLYGTPIIQEYIPEGGDAIGVSCLFDYNHREKAVFAHKRLRQYPIKGGPSTLRESIRHKEAEEIAVKVLKKLKTLNASYNVFIHYSPNGKDLHFHIEVAPRFAVWAGFEFSSNDAINSVTPEDAAKFYRG